jgi:hypothetical protein
MLSSAVVEAVWLRMMEARKALADYQKLNGLAPSGDHASLTKELARQANSLTSTRSKTRAPHCELSGSPGSSPAPKLNCRPVWQSNLLLYSFGSLATCGLRLRAVVSNSIVHGGNADHRSARNCFIGGFYAS